MKAVRISLLLIFTFWSLSAFAYSDEPDLSHVKTLQDAQAYYNSCYLVLFTPNVTRDQIAETNQRLYYLGRRLGMLSINEDEKYSAFCQIEVRSEAEEREVTSLMYRITYVFKGLQSLLLGPLGHPLEKMIWMNFESTYHLLGSGSTILKISDNIVCVEYKINGVNFIVFHNTDHHFAYDIKVYHKEKKYSKKQRKNVYQTYERDITVLPEGAFVISSSVDDTGMYFMPSSFKTTNKYFVH